MATYILREQNRVAGVGGGSLFKALKGVLINQATDRVRTLNKTAITNSSGGTPDAGGAIAAVVIPSAYSSPAATVDKAPKAGFDTAIAAIYNDHITIAEWVNTVRVALGLGQIVYTGTPALSGTVQAITSALTAVDGTTVCLDYATGLAQINNAIKNQSALIDAIVEVLGAVQTMKPISGFGNNVNFTSLAFTASAATATGVPGNVANSTMSNAAVSAALGVLRTNLATLVGQLTAGLTGLTVTNAPMQAAYVGAIPIRF